MQHGRGFSWRCGRRHTGCDRWDYFRSCSDGGFCDLPEVCALYAGFASFQRACGADAAGRMGLEAMLDCDMHLGEGTGAITLFPILDLACAVYNSMSTFEEASIEQYEHLS